MLWFTESGKLALCDNGKVANTDECPCGCNCHQPLRLIVTVTNAQFPNEDANGVYLAEKYHGEPLYNDTGNSPYTFPYNDYTYVILRNNLMFYFKCESLSKQQCTLFYRWDDGYDVGPTLSSYLTENLSTTFDTEWGFWEGQLNVEPVF